jgi:hypothetical protein
MKRTAAFALAALSFAAPLAAGCTRTSDGSVVMRRPLFGGLLRYRADDEQAARIVPSRTLPRQSSQPPAPSFAVAHPDPQPTVSVPAMNIARKPPIRNVDPAKPLSCTNTKTAEGRIRVVCT